MDTVTSKINTEHSKHPVQAIYLSNANWFIHSLFRKNAHNKRGVSDWLRTVQFFLNTSSKKEVIQSKFEKTKIVAFDWILKNGAW